MNALYAARRSRDLEFAAFVALVKVLMNSDKFFYAYSIIPTLAKALGIPDQVAIEIIDECVNDKPIKFSGGFTTDFAKLDQLLMNQPSACSIQEETSYYTANQSISQTLEVSYYCFDDLLGVNNAWYRFMKLQQRGGTRQQFEEVREEIIKAAAKLRYQVALE